MNKLKEIGQFFIICYISCFITKIALNKLIFETDLLLDSLFISTGATFGFYIGNYLIKRWHNQKK